ncbi:MAG: bifunctional YncE family protein/alkaline phosphatase family protein, partial [Verrucomicrobiota bacterium]
VHLAVHPGGRYAILLHAGYGQHELVVVHLADFRIVSRTALAETFYGVAFSADGRRVFASGAGSEVVHRFDFSEGLLANPLAIEVRPVQERGIVSGVAVSPDGRRLFTTELYGGLVSEVDASTGARRWAAPVGVRGQASLAETRVPGDFDQAAAEKRAIAQKDPQSPAAPYPYACAFDAVQDRLYVTLWAQATVVVLDAANGRELARWRTEEHPNELLLNRAGTVLYVANANRNTVSVFDTASGKSLETLSASLQPDAPPGSTPNSLALSPDEEFLFVANAGNNCVALFEVEKPGHSRSLGFIPVGWYPTSVRVTPDGKSLLVANGKGISSKSNRHGPQPGRELPGNLKEYIGGLFQGALSVIPVPSGPKRDETLREYSERARRCAPAPAVPEVSTRRGRQNPIPARVGGRSPIQHVLYVIKENRTYDQVLGDLPGGNGDPSLCLFPEPVTPNQHALAREFVLLDNFYVDSEVSADGHEWSMGAYATDFVEKSWPLSYGHNQKGKYPYPSEGTLPVAANSGGYLWDQARKAGVSFRSYGEWIALPSRPEEPARARVPSLEGHFDPWFRPYDLDYPDVKRAERFIAELRRFEQEGSMPRLQILRLPNNHTYGTTAGKPTPTAMVAENDLALGRLVEAVSRSQFWKTTAIFVLEDDAQNGPDHVDAHRSIAFVASPHAKRGFRDSTMYSTCSMLRTMELILGLPPMSQFDAAAAPMYHSFTGRPDFRPFECRPATVKLDEKNVAGNWGAERSAKMDFSKEDAADDLELNEVIWRSVRGPDQPMPAPRRAAFVLAGGGDDDDDDE